MPITVTNKSTKPVRSAGIDFKPGKNDFPEGKLSRAQLAQIRAVESLSVAEKVAKETKS